MSLSGGASPSWHSVEQFSEQPLALRQSLIRQHNGLRLADWIFDHALAMQSVQHLPVVPLPGTGSVVQGQLEQCQHCLVDFVGIDGPCRSPGLAEAGALRSDDA